MESFNGLWFDNEEVFSHTSVEQQSCERECSPLLIAVPDVMTKLLRESHVTYLYTGLGRLASGYVSLDASRPWIIYWIVHALSLLGENLSTEMMHKVVDTLACIQNSSDSPKTILQVCHSPTPERFVTGGFGGAPYQLSHCAPNYAAVLALCSMGGDKALRSIDRSAMYRFFLSVKDASGGFCMHVDGEVDTRGTYTVIAIARILNILTPELVDNVAEFILTCQTYEGGFGGEPFNEAHGGYNFCALAALFILKQQHRCDMRKQERWLLSRQMRLEGGFQGRTNKLVDSCYSFWQGAALAILKMIQQGGDDLSDVPLSVDSHASEIGTIGAIVGEGIIEELPRMHAVKDNSGGLSFNQRALQRYILSCAQDLDRGGLRDKPGKGRDFYHTCYALSGLSIAQHAGGGTDTQVYGDYSNLLTKTSAVYNVEVGKLRRAVDFFAAMGPPVHATLLSQMDHKDSVLV